MKKLKQYFIREFSSYKNIYLYLLLIKGVILITYYPTQILITGTMKEAVSVILVFLLSMLIIFTVPFLLITSFIKDKGLMGDIKLLGKSNSYFLIKFFTPIFLIIPEMIVSFFVHDLFLMLNPFLIYFIIQFITIAIIIFTRLNIKWDYATQALIFSILTLVLTTVFTFIHFVNYLVTLFNDVSPSLSPFFIYYYVFVFIVDIIIIHIWSLLFDKKSEV